MGFGSAGHPLANGSPWTCLSPSRRATSAPPSSRSTRKAVGGQGFWAFWGLIVLISLGTGAIVCSATRSRHEKLDSFFKAWPLTLPRPQLPPPPANFMARREAIATRRAPIITEYYLGDCRASARRPLTGLSSISLIMLLTYFAVLVAMWSAYWFPLTSVGFKVRLLRPGVASQRSPGLQPIIVQVAYEKRTASDGQRRPRPSLWVNRTLVSRDDFEAVLQKELNLRPRTGPFISKEIRTWTGNTPCR